MTQKKDINQEIAELKNYLSVTEDTHPDYIPSSVKELQSLVLVTHAHLEVALETRILLQIKRKLDDISDYYWERLLILLSPLLNSLRYRDKLIIIESYGDTTKELINALSRVNTRRNEFAHARGYQLNNKYNRSPHAEENIRDLLRTLVQGKREMDNYFIKIEGAPKP